MNHLPLLASILAAVAVGGCVEQTLSIRSDPPGALVYLNDEEVGRTPLKRDFTWYGDYGVTLRKEGYETQNTHRKMTAPWYMWPPFDLVSELCSAKDHREWVFTMKPLPPDTASAQEITQRGEELAGNLRSSEHTRPPTSAATAPSTRPTKKPGTRPTTKP